MTYDKIITTIVNHGIQVVLSGICIWLMLSINNERKEYIAELTKYRTEYIKALTDLTSQMSSIKTDIEDIKYSIKDSKRR